MKISHFVRRLAAVAPLLLATALPVRAHNGSLARAAPAENIVVDGEFSDWPITGVPFAWPTTPPPTPSTSPLKWATNPP